MAIVEFKDVSRVYQSGDHKLKALDNVSMKLDEGKFDAVSAHCRFDYGYNDAPTDGEGENANRYAQGARL